MNWVFSDHRAAFALQAGIEFHSTGDLVLGRMSLGNAADQLKRAKGIIALAAVFAKLLTVFLRRYSPHIAGDEHMNHSFAHVLPQ